MGMMIPYIDKLLHGYEYSEHGYDDTLRWNDYTRPWYNYTILGMTIPDMGMVMPEMLCHIIAPAQRSFNIRHHSVLNSQCYDYLPGRVIMLWALFVTGHMCFLVCMTGHVAAVEPGGWKPLEGSNDVDGSVTKRHWRHTRRQAFVSQHTPHC